MDKVKQPRRGVVTKRRVVKAARPKTKADTSKEDALLAEIAVQFGKAVGKGANAIVDNMRNWALYAGSPAAAYAYMMIRDQGRVGHTENLLLQAKASSLQKVRAHMLKFYVPEDGKPEVEPSSVFAQRRRIKNQLLKELVQFVDMELEETGKSVESMTKIMMESAKEAGYG